MRTFYFTYGSSGQPFIGGLTGVQAPHYGAARRAALRAPPPKTQGAVNCSSVYDEGNFKQTEMYRSGNFDRRCHEVITLRREAATN